MLHTAFKFILAGTIAVSASAQTTPPAPKAAGVAPGNQVASADTAYRFPQTGITRQADRYYNMIWGVDSFSVKTVESGELVRFNYRVLDPEKAKILNDKTAEPSLIDPQAGVKLVVPSLEKVGQLRQSSTPKAGMTYWMAFSNSGRHVKRGDHISVQIGTFRVDGLIVQ
ncbi:MAG TPA: hypothetical protein VGG85_04855 [Terracidiphilus sp.]